MELRSADPLSEDNVYGLAVSGQDRADREPSGIHGDPFDDLLDPAPSGTPLTAATMEAPR